MPATRHAAIEARKSPPTPSAITPANVDALYDRGNALLSLGRLTEALAVYDQTLEIDPVHIGANHHRSNLLIKLNRLEESLESLRRTLALKPDHYAALCNRANVLVKLHRFDEGVASFQSALIVDPGSAPAFSAMARAYAETRYYDDALKSYTKALTIDPETPDNVLEYGNLLFSSHHFDEARKTYEKYLQICPGNTDVYVQLGNCLSKINRHVDAIRQYDTALIIDPRFDRAHFNRANSLKELDRPHEAIAAYDNALAARPDHAGALNNRGNTLKALDHHHRSLDDYAAALTIWPGFAAALCNQANALKELGRIDEAVTSYDRALAIKPDFADALLNRGVAHLTMGDFAKGWPDYETRFSSQFYLSKIRIKNIPRWRGEPLAGKSIVIDAEQGIGDVILCLRYVLVLAAHGAKVTFITPPNLSRLFRAFDRKARMVTYWRSDEPGIDFFSPLMSLPYRFGTNGHTIPGGVPYLSAEEALVAKWRDRLGIRGFKIGICWQGNPNSPVEAGRSAPLQQFARLARIPGVRLISLQKIHGLDQLATLPSNVSVETLGDDFDAGADAFVDTAAVMNCLDLIVTVDTAIGHLAGALGRPVWLALQHVPYWTWMLHRSDTPWYPSMRLFRQAERRNWQAVFDEIADEVAKVAGNRPEIFSERLYSASARRPVAPVSWGELIDKITILEIKMQRLTKLQALANVQEEHALLTSLVETNAVRQPSLDNLMLELRSINEALWNVEDAIRQKEARKEFDQEFITLARSVYSTNDRRAEVKRRINELLNSDLMEEKQYSQYSMDG